MEWTDADLFVLGKSLVVLGLAYVACGMVFALPVRRKTRAEE
jgi:hypothetical protein